MVQENSLVPLICILGPTAVGKSALGVELAKRLNGAVISADAFQLYRGMNIGTAKPTESEMQGVPHYMIDVKSPCERYDSADFANDVCAVLDSLRSKDTPAILVGGTAFYVKTLLYGLDFGNSYSEEIRKDLNSFLQEHGKEELYAYLQKVDERSAGELSPNDTKRVMRALEIFLVTGQRKSEGEQTKKVKIPHVLYALDMPRNILYRRINRRVDQMFEEGLIDEVRTLLQTVNPSAQSMQAIGYKETVAYLNGVITKEECISQIQQHTRNYAKRQITFLKKMQPIWLDARIGTVALADRILAGAEDTESPRNFSLF